MLESWETEKAALVCELAEKEQAANRQNHGNLQRLARLKEAASQESQKWATERQQLRAASESCNESNASLQREIEIIQADKEALIKSMAPSALEKASENGSQFLRELQS